MILLVRIGQRILPNTASLGLFLVAISPMWFVHVNSPITEPISILMFLGFMERWTRENRTLRDEIFGGLFLGGLTLCRAMFLWLPVAVVLFELIHRKAPKGAKLEPRRIIPFIASGFALPLAWGARNWALTGTFAMTQDSWTAIMMAWYVTWLPLLDWRMEEHVQMIYSHPWQNALHGTMPAGDTTNYAELMKNDLISFIREHPLQYISNLFPKTLRLWVNGWWNPFNYAFSPRYFGSAYIWSFAVPMLVLGVIGLFNQWSTSKGVAQWRAVRLQLLLALYITALTLPFTVDARYSVIAYVTFSLWAGTGLLLLFQPQEKKK
jgi:hypothetical protein